MRQMKIGTNVLQILIAGTGVDIEQPKVYTITKYKDNMGPILPYGKKQTLYNIPADISTAIDEKVKRCRPSIGNSQRKRRKAARQTPASKYAKRR